MAETYPFHLISPHSKYRVNSQLDNTWVRNVYKIQGREINELDANSANTALVNIRKLRRYELVKPYHSISTPSIIGA